MMYAYDEMYLRNARCNMGNMLHYAVYGAGQSLIAFYDMFINSRIASAFEHGSPKYIAGRSGTELVHEVFYELSGKNDGPYEPDGAFSSEHTAAFSDGKSPEFWAGYALAHYQWYSVLSFAHINEIVPVDKVLSMYPKYHEMDILQFVDRMEELRNDSSRLTRLKAYRTRLGLSQGELSAICDIPLKTIQNYEQRQKNINKAGVDYVIRLAHALHCRVEDLME